MKRKVRETFETSVKVVRCLTLLGGVGHCLIAKVHLDPNKFQSKDKLHLTVERLSRKKREGAKP